jgi:catalase
MTVTPREAVDAANALFGRHGGFRSLHAKGTLLKGTFTATPEAAALSRAGHMQGEPVPVTVRVSNGAGNPEHADYRPDVRGFAVKFYLPDGSRTDIVAQTSPRFPFATPDGFVAVLKAQKAPWKLPLVMARYPGLLATLPATMGAMKPPESYATCNYYAIHAFQWLDANGGSRYVRYKLVPEAGDHRIGPKAAKERGRDYLKDEIRERLERGPVRFTLELQIAAAGDAVDNPSAAWPADRERVNAGTLELTGLETERETGGDILVFDPTRMTDGIEMSNDPVLRFRHDAYGESVARRMES